MLAKDTIEFNYSSRERKMQHESAIIIKYVDGRFIIGDDVGTSIKIVSEDSEGKTLVIDKNFNIHPGYERVEQDTELNFSDDEAVNFNIYQGDSYDEYNTLTWECEIGGKTYKVTPKEVDLRVVTTDCRDHSCNKYVKPCKSYWCTTCHGDPCDNWAYVYHQLYGFPKTWHELKVSALKILL